MAGSCLCSRSTRSRTWRPGLRWKANNRHRGAYLFIVRSELCHDIRFEDCTKWRVWMNGLRNANMVLCSVLFGFLTSWTLVLKVIDRNKSFCSFIPYVLLPVMLACAVAFTPGQIQRKLDCPCYQQIWLYINIESNVFLFPVFAVSWTELTL